MAGGDSLFTLDIVREYIMTKGGKITNHELVNHFKTFLNDPINKATNRQKFKEFVNTLATVKLDESGEKMLVLKRKYRDGASTPGKSPAAKASLPKIRPKAKKAKLAEQYEASMAESESPVMERRAAKTRVDEGAGAASAGAADESVDSLADSHGDITDSRVQDMSDDFAAPLPSIGEDSTDMSSEILAMMDKFKTETGLDRSEVIVEEEEEPTPPAEPVPAPVEAPRQPTPPPLPILPPEPEPMAAVREEPVFSETEPDGAAAAGLPDSQSMCSFASSQGTADSSLEDETDGHKPSPERAVTPLPEGFVTPAPTKGPGAAPGAPPLSVKQRVEQLHKMESSSNLVGAEGGAQKRRGERKKYEDDDDESSASGVIVSLDDEQREWMKAAASADYQKMAKMLQSNPELAPWKDFMLSALHWAAKHGNGDIVKLLCGGEQGVDLNAKSGYTALHLAAQHGHEHIIELLVKGYSANPHVRDHSGRKAKQYLSNAASTSIHQLLQARRLSQTGGVGTGGFKRQGSYSTKIRSAFGINVGAAVRNSWTSNPSPSPSPAGSPGGSRKGSVHSDSSSGGASLMPPPKDVPRRGKRRKAAKEHLSDSELGGSRSGSEVDLRASTPTFSSQGMMDLESGV